MTDVLRANYDDIADVLYLTIGTRRPDRYEEDDQGLVWRFDLRGVPYGVTIFDYAECWARRRRTLTKCIVARLQVDPEEANRVLSTA